MKMYKLLDFVKVALIGSKGSKDIINSFHKIFYYSPCAKDVKFMGVGMQKNPLDLWVYQEIIYSTKPDIIIESGSGYGGSTIFLASLLETFGKGKIISIDIKKRKRPLHDRILYLNGSSIDEKIIDKIKLLVGNKRCMVILDSNHDKQHVLKELVTYEKFVTKGCYMIVEDSNVHGHPVIPEHVEGPFEAISDFLSKNKSFKIDKSKEKFLLTFNPNGYLLKVK